MMPIERRREILDETDDDDNRIYRTPQESDFDTLAPETPPASPREKTASLSQRSPLKMKVDAKHEISMKQGSDKNEGPFVNEISETKPLTNTKEADKLSPQNSFKAGPKQETTFPIETDFIDRERSGLSNHKKNDQL